MRNGNTLCCGLRWEDTWGESRSWTWPCRHEEQRACWEEGTSQARWRSKGWNPIEGHRNRLVCAPCSGSVAASGSPSLPPSGSPPGRRCRFRWRCHPSPTSSNWGGLNYAVFITITSIRNRIGEIWREFRAFFFQVEGNWSCRVKAVRVLYWTSWAQSALVFGSKMA